MEVKDIIAEGRPLEPSESTRHKTYTWYKIGVHDGYDYALEEFENNRLKACDTLTPEEAERESAFVVPFVKEYHRTPTFSDAIEETRKQMIDKACKLLCDICYFGKSAHASTDSCKVCKAKGGDYYRFTKLAKE